HAADQLIEIISQALPPPLELVYAADRILLRVRARDLLLSLAQQVCRQLGTNVIVAVRVPAVAHALLPLYDFAVYPPKETAPSAHRCDGGTLGRGSIAIVQCTRSS